jgi:hypothetical protein
MTTTFIKDLRLNNFFLKNRIAKKIRVGILLATGFSAFTLDIQTGIS